MSTFTFQYTTETQKDIIAEKQSCINKRKLNSAQHKTVKYSHEWCQRCEKSINDGQMLVTKYFSMDLEGLEKQCDQSYIQRCYLFFL